MKIIKLVKSDAWYEDRKLLNGKQIAGRFGADGLFYGHLTKFSGLTKFLHENNLKNYFVFRRQSIKQVTKGKQNA